MQRAGRIGLLLINLGTPESPDPAHVRPYLREFLRDPRVLDIPAWQRFVLLNLVILPFRPRRSGEAYEKIWTERGSPLLVYTQALADKVRASMDEDVVVDVAMRYGEPSIRSALARLRSADIDRIIVFPLYPQYSSAATGSSIEKVVLEAAASWNTPYLRFVPPFYDHQAYIDACARVIRPALEAGRTDALLFSFHGLPERHCRKSDDTGAHCLASAGCCDRIVHANRNCYRAQCFATARALGDRLQVDESKRIVCFQSRLGRTPWIKPYTDVVLSELPGRGVRHAVIASPAFVADCLETLEELGIRAVDTFRASGGEELRVAPCVNDDDLWAAGVAGLAREAWA
jgi:ferrochelatase